MSVVKPASLILTAVLCLLHAGCIDIREEVWLKRNGSGQAVLDCSLPATAVRLHGGDDAIRELIDGFLKETPEITSSRHEVETTGDRTRISIAISFDSALDLAESPSRPALEKLPSAVTRLAGRIESRIDGRRIEVTRTLDPGRALPASSLMPASQFDGHRITSIVHLPAPATSSNATRTENGGRTLVWDTPLAGAVDAPLVSHFETRIPLPWPLICAAALPVFLLGGWLVMHFRKTARPAHPRPACEIMRS